MEGDLAGVTEEMKKITLSGIRDTDEEIDVCIFNTAKYEFKKDLKHLKIFESLITDWSVVPLSITHYAYEEILVSIRNATRRTDAATSYVALHLMKSLAKKLSEEKEYQTTAAPFLHF